MKVSDVMQKSVISISEGTPIKEVGRLIFSLGIAGIPVVRDKKLVGIVTEQDILVKLFPSIQEIAEDFFNVSNFELMEANLLNFFNTPVEQIMNKKPVSATSEMPLMRVQSLMLVNKFSRVPIVDKKGNLIGIISQGDIFRQLLKNEIPKIEKERYAGFIAKHYDLMVNWEKRLKWELPVLFRIFKKEKVQNILDVGTWTGEYALALAKRGVRVLGLDHNQIMIQMSEKKKERLPFTAKKNIKFMLTDFSDLPTEINESFDAAVCLGNALPYIPASPENLFKGVFSSLRQKNGVMIIQTLNFEKLLKTKDRLISFMIQKSELAYEKEHLFLEFFDRETNDWLSHHVVIFDSDGKNWLFKGITTIKIRYLRKNDLEKALKKAGFKKISFSGNMGEYQGDYGKLSFSEPFKSLESDWLNVIARK